MKITLAAELRSSNFLMFWKAETFYRETPSAKKKIAFFEDFLCQLVISSELVKFISLHEPPPQSSEEK